MKSIVLVFALVALSVSADEQPCSGKEFEYFTRIYDSSNVDKGLTQKDVDVLTVIANTLTNSHGYLPTQWQYYRPYNMKWKSKKLAEEFPAKYIAATNRLAKYEYASRIRYEADLIIQAKREADAEAMAERKLRESILNQEVILQQIRNELYDRGW